MANSVSINKKSRSKLPATKLLVVLGLLLVVVIGLMVWKLSNAGKFNLTELPKVKVLSWLNQTKPLAPPATVGVYDFSAIDSTSEAKRLAGQLLGNTNLISKKNSLIGYSEGSAGDNSDLSALVFNTRTNTFSYSATKGYKLGTVGDASIKANQFLQTLIADQTLKATATYKKTDKPGVTFVEFHRDWNAVGSPIVNPLGLLNMKPTEQLSALSLGGQSSRQPDNSIYGTSDQSDGLGRRADFNTAVVGINEAANTVVAVNSNLRQLKSNSGSQSNVIGYDKAVNSLTSGKYAFFNTTPDGEGLPAFEKVYPNHQGSAKRAVVTDSSLAYLEELPGVNQTKLEPYYIFRGTATLDSGYKVRFVAGVAATEKSLAAHLLGFLRADSAYAEDTGPAGSGATLTPPTNNPPTDNPPQPPTISLCTPSTEDLSNQQKVSGSLWIGQLKKSGLDKINAIDNHHGEIIDIGDWYTFSDVGILTSDDVLAALKAVPADARERKNRAMQELSENPSCPVRITGNSPSLFVYGPVGTTVSIAPSSQTSYSDPGLRGGTWNVRVGSAGVIANGLALPYVYYEYQPVNFARPAEGWKVSKSKLPELARKLSAQLQLNAIESDRLGFELNNAASGIRGDNLFVGPLDAAEVNSKLPLAVSGQVAVVRLQFYVGKDDVGSYARPVLTPVQRSESMVLELGASAER